MAEQNDTNAGKKRRVILPADKAGRAGDQYRAGQKQKSPFHESIFLETAPQINSHLVLSPAPP